MGRGVAGEEISVEKIEVREKFSADTKKSETSTAAEAAFLPEAARGDPARGKGRLGAAGAAVSGGMWGREGSGRVSTGPGGSAGTRRTWQAKPARRPGARER